MPGPAPLFFYQTHGLEHLKMLRYRWTAHRQPVGEFAYGGRPASKQIQNRLAGGIGKSRQQLPLVAHDLP